MSSVEAATKKAGVLWLTFPGSAPVLVWHLWHDGSAWVVCGGAEQPVPDVGAAAAVTVGSKHEGAVTWAAVVEVIPAGSERWDSVVPLLHDKRLNPPDGEDQPARWARESTLLRLTPR